MYVPIVFQALDEDYADNLPTGEVVRRVSNPHVPDGLEAYEFTIFRGDVSSRSPTPYGVYYPRYGYFLSTTGAGGNARQDYVASTGNGNDESVLVRTPRWVFDLPMHLFLTISEAAECAREFCASGGRSARVKWVRHADLGRELFADEAV